MSNEHDSANEEQAVETIRDVHGDFLALVVAAADGDVREFREHADDVERAIDDAEYLIRSAGEGE